MIDTSSMKTPAVKTERNYLDINYDLLSWLFPTDHKRIAMLFLGAMSLFVILGGAMASMLRAELSNPREALYYADIYNRIFTMHGVVMVYFFVLPALLAVIAAFVLPLMIGARQLAYPHLNLFSLHTYMVGGLLMLLALITGGMDAGWNLVTPFGTVFSGGDIELTVLSMMAAVLSAALIAVNIIATVHKMRAHGLFWFKLPLFVWATFVASVALLVGTPFLFALSIRVILEHANAMGWIGFGGNLNPLLVQRMFWLFARAAVYIMIIPAIGATADIIVSFAKKPLFAYKSTVYALIAAAGLMVLSWGTHLPVAVQTPSATFLFSILSFLMLGTLALIILNLIATLSGGEISLQAPMVYALAFVGNLSIAWVAWLYLSAPMTNMQLQGTQFETGHFHYLMVGGVVTAFMAALHYWWPKMTGRTYQEGWGRIAAGILFVGVNTTYFPQLILGYLGMRSRVPTYPDQFEMLNALSSEGFVILTVGLIMPILYLSWGIFFGESAGANPWNTNGLEWIADSPPPLKNFAAVPAVSGEVYNLKVKIIDDVILPAITTPAVPEKAVAAKLVTPTKPDDLTKIEGIGPKISGLLQAAGINTFSRLAQARISQLQHILDDAGPRYRMAKPETWPKQSELAAAAKWEELKALQDTLHGGKHK